MSNLLIRAASGAVFVSIMIFCIWHSLLATAILFSVLVAIGLDEFYKMSNALEGVRTNRLLGITLGTYSFVSAYLFILGYISYHWVLFSLIMLVIGLLFELFRKSQQPIVNSALLVFGLFYVVAPFYTMLLLRGTQTDEWMFLVGMFVLIWTNDSFAYLTGRFLGNNKLFERISPKKTWEGTIGGIVFAVIAGYLVATWIQDDVIFWMVAALLVALGSIFGDLFESMFKRNTGIKDSGNIMPGHGGVLDRFDAALFSAPIFYLWLLFYS